MDLPSVIYDLPFLSEKAKRNIVGENACHLLSLDFTAHFPPGTEAHALTLRPAPGS